MSLDPDGWRAILCNEPFFLTPEAVGRLTDREAWEWYIHPALVRAKKLEAAREGYATDDDGEPWQPTTEAETLEYLRKLGVTGVPGKPGAEE